MKKRIAMLAICAVTVTSMLACAKDTDSQDTDTIEVTEQTQEEENTEKEYSSASAPEIAYTSVEAEGYDYFEGQVQCLEITDDSHPELKSAIDDYFSGVVDNFNVGIEDWNEEAKQQNEEMGDEGYEMKYSDNITVDLKRLDNKVLSFVLNDYVYLGGAHGGGSFTGVSFDVGTGEQITLDDLGDADSIRETSKEYILNTIDTSSDEAKANLFDDDVINYKEVIEELFSNGNQPEFYLDTLGITFIFQQYDIAPYAAGMISFTVPYSEYDEIADRYTPLEDMSYAIKLSEAGFNSSVDFDGDGELENISVVNTWDEETDTNYYILRVGDDGLKEETGNGSWITGYFIHNEEGNFVLIANDGISIDLYEVSNGIEAKGHMDTTLYVKEVTESGFTLGELSYDDSNVASWSNEEQHGFVFE